MSAASGSQSRLSTVQKQIAASNLNNLVSPSFLIEPPQIRHLDLIPSSTINQMLPAWEQVWFPPRPLDFEVIENAFVVEEGLVFRSDGSVIEASIQQHSASMIESARKIVLSLSPGDCPNIRGDVVLCRKSGEATYGHWLVELVPKIFLGSQLAVPCRFLLPRIKDVFMSSVVKQSLAALCVNEHSIVYADRNPVCVERLIVISGLTEHGTYMSPLAIDCLQAMSAHIPPNGAEAIFVTRPTSVGRHMVDESRIAEAFQKQGFTIVESASMPFMQQIATFKAARRVVGVMGSALANLAFCQEGAQVAMIAPAKMPDTFFWFLAHHRKLGMLDIRCNADPKSETGNFFSENIVVEDGDMFDIQSFFESHNADMHGTFDEQYYLRQSVVDDPSRVDALEHYIRTGWREGRNPSRNFNGNLYLQQYRDVAASGMNPLIHYIRHGRKEGRNAFGESLADQPSST